MIHYSCDRCKASLPDPLDAERFIRSSLVDHETAKRGISLRLPLRVAINNGKDHAFRMEVAHLCRSCMQALDSWRTMPRSVDQSLVDDR